MTADRQLSDDEVRRFYALIGYCITGYQSVEDYLETVFWAALGGEREKSDAIFRVARGLEAKLDLVTASLIGAEARHVAKWGRLCPRVATAAGARNRIAHATPVSHGGVHTLTLDENEVVRVTQTEPPRMELHKASKAGTTVWTLATLREEHERSRTLFGHLIAFTKELRGEPVPEHLEGG